MSTLAAFTFGTFSIAAFTSSARIPATGHPGAVSVILSVTLSSAQSNP
jgi:hypothetical protein